MIWFWERDKTLKKIQRISGLVKPFIIISYKQYDEVHRSLTKRWRYIDSKKYPE
jgi:hypothetical protein